MKKFLTLTMVLAGATFAFSQGQVNFNNVSGFTTTAPTAANGHNDRLVYYTDNTKLSGTNWVAQLYFAPGSGQAEGSLQIISGDTPTQFFTTANTAAAGFFNGTSKFMPGVAAGTTATLQVRVWNGALFSTYENSVANNGINGKSVTFNYLAPQPPSTAFAMEGLQSFTVGAIPEPSTIALGILGAASLLVVRRRK